MSLIEKGPSDAVDFTESLRRAEAEAGVPPDAELYAVEDEVAPEAPQPEVQAEVAEEPEPETVEAVEEPKVDNLAELNQKLGRLLNENADQKRQLEQLLTAREQPQQQPVTQESLSYFDEYAAENPVQAVQYAVQQQNGLLYDRALRAWYDQDPVSAGRYERQAELAVAQQNMQQQFQPQIQSAQGLVQTRELEQALDAVHGRHEDFAQVIGTLDENRVKDIVESGLPTEILQGLTGGQQEKEKVIETLYRWVKAEQAGSFAAAADEATAKAAAEAKSAKVDATVASASTTTPDSVPVSEAERQARAWAERPSLRDAWEGRSSSRV